MNLTEENNKIKIISASPFSHPSNPSLWIPTLDLGNIQSNYIKDLIVVIACFQCDMFAISMKWRSHLCILISSDRHGPYLFSESSSDTLSDETKLNYEIID